MKKVLVDTSVLIEFLRFRKKRTAYEKILSRGWRPVVSFITPAELWAGKSVWETKQKAELLETLLSGIGIIYPSLDTLKFSGKLRAKFGISLLDGFIAACAIEHELPLATLNVKDFKKIKGVELIEV